MFEPLVELLNAGIVREAQASASADSGDARGSGHDQEAQGAHAPEQVRLGPFAGSGERADVPSDRRQVPVGAV